MRRICITFAGSKIGRLGRFGLLNLIGVLAVAGAASDDPAAQLASFQVAEGFEVNLFASEAEGIANPIQCRFDEAGRLYVACSWVYPQLKPGEVADDKIIVLEDTDGDGRADRSTVFADGLMIPTGIEIGDGGVYVGNGTELLHLRDTDGDGRADERRVVLRGFGTGDAHQNINSFRWGPSGELMFSQGLHAFSRVETPWGIETLDHAGIWRLRPRLLRLEGFFGDELPPHNPWGFAFDDWGRLFVVAGNGHGMFYPLPIMIPDHARLPLGQIWENHQGRKLSGVDIVGSRHLPEELQGAMIAGGFMNHAVYAFRIEEAGSGFRVVDRPPLLVSTHESFRPVDVKVGPDGAIYVADWYNPIIGHYQASFRHPDRDRTHGRIWRITAKGRPLVERPRLAGASVEALLEQLKSGERWNRYQAKRMLGERATGSVTNAVARWVGELDAEGPDFERHLFEALGVYQWHEAVEPELLGRLLRARDADARAYAAGVIRDWHDRLENPVGLLARAAEDEHPRVRLSAVVSAAHIPEAGALAVATRVLDREMDMFLDYALRQTVRVLKPHWLPAFRSGGLDGEGHPERLEFVLKADGSADTLEALLERVRRRDVSRESKAAMLGIVAEVGDAEALAVLLDRGSYETQEGYDGGLQAEGLEELAEAARQRGARPTGDVTESLNGLLEGADEGLQGAVLRLAGVWGLEAFRDRMEEVAASGTVSGELRVAAIEGMSALGGVRSRERLVELSGTAGAAPVRNAAIVGLVTVDIEAAAARAADVLAGDESGARVEALMPAFLQRTEGSGVLAEAMRGSSPTRDAARVAVRLMSGVGRQDAELAAVLTEAAELGGEPPRFSAEELEALMEEVRAGGDARRGAAVFRRADVNCLACHAVGGEGGHSGPDLNAIGTGQPLDFIIGAVLEPDREVKEGYHAIEVTTRDGGRHQGYVVRSDGSELVMRDVLLDREVRIRRDRIEEERAVGSLMPSGLVDHLTRAELRDLFRYLSGLGKPGS